MEKKTFWRILVACSRSFELQRLSYVLGGHGWHTIPGNTRFSTGARGFSAVGEARVGGVNSRSTATSAGRLPNTPPLVELNESVVAIGVGVGGAAPMVHAGSGFVASANGLQGLVLTAHNVIHSTNPAATDASTRKYCVGVDSPIVWTYEAEIVRMQRSGDPMLDLAILRVTRRLDGAPLPTSFKAIEFADSDAVREGEPVWILGYGQQQSNLTNTRNAIKGIVSGRHRDAKGGNFIRTDAEMLAGHSGGPVVNRSGQVIGWSDPDGPSTGGIHTMKPINDARPALTAAGVGV